jgi:D-alanyl-D-alanine carboxypeptidase (penicillin-binding protein 5/6)
MPEFEFNGIKQQNRNGLLGHDPSVDGLKTGHTDSAGFCLVTSAQRDGMRLVSVVLGSSSMKGRESASAALFNYGFTFYETKLAVKGGSALGSTQVWKAEKTPFEFGVTDDLYLTVPRGESANIKTSIALQPRLIAPLTQASTVGDLSVSGGGEKRSIPLHPLHEVAAGGWWRRLIDTIRLWFA